MADPVEVERLRRGAAWGERPRLSSVSLFSTDRARFWVTGDRERERERDVAGERAGERERESPRGERERETLRPLI
jgi:hypothetical protein